MPQRQRAVYSTYVTGILSRKPHIALHRTHIDICFHIPASEAAHVDTASNMLHTWCVQYINTPELSSAAEVPVEYASHAPSCTSSKAKPCTHVASTLFCTPSPPPHHHSSFLFVPHACASVTTGQNECCILQSTFPAIHTPRHIPSGWLPMLHAQATFHDRVLEPSASQNREHSAALAQPPHTPPAAAWPWAQGHLPTGPRFHARCAVSHSVCIGSVWGRIWLQQRRSSKC